MIKVILANMQTGYQVVLSTEKINENKLLFKITDTWINYMNSTTNNTYNLSLNDNISDSQVAYTSICKFYLKKKELVVRNSFSLMNLNFMY